MVGTLIRRPLPPVSDFIRTLLDDTSATAALATLGVVSGTYTPTTSNVSNVDASTAYLARYIRVGNIVTVAGRVDVDTTAALTGTTLHISLPVASDLAATTDLGGVFSVNASTGGVVFGHVANNVAECFWTAGVTTNQAGGYVFMYTVI